MDANNLAPMCVNCGEMMTGDEDTFWCDGCGYADRPETEYGEFYAVDYCKGWRIEVYGGQEDGATVCRIVSADGKSEQCLSDDSMLDAVRRSRQWVFKQEK